MSVTLIKDYLQTQGLRLPLDDVRMAYMTAQAVINMGATSVERSILWYANDKVVLANYFDETADNEALLKQVFMALDSVFSRDTSAQSAVVYALRPSETNERELVRLSQQGKELAQVIEVNENTSWTHLPSRTAQTGWLNLVQDVAHWQSIEELEGEHYSQSQISLPICNENGTVYGVVHVEHTKKDAFDEAAQVAWVGLALALVEPVRTLLGIENKGEQDG